MSIDQLNLIKIENNTKFLKKFTFCTLVTDLNEYYEMLESARKKGFDGDDIEFMYFDNTQVNTFDGFAGINRALREAKGEFLIFCHQDILFNDDDRTKLEQCLNELDAHDHRWGVAGNAGRNEWGDSKVRITDPNLQNLSVGTFPEKVMGLDENLLIINRKYTFGCSTLMSGFHLYGIDLCQNAKDLGLNSYVIDFHLLHKSGGNLNESFYKAQEQYKQLQRVKKAPAIIWTICTKFYVSHSRFLNWLYSFDYFFNKKNKKIMKKNRK